MSAFEAAAADGRRDELERELVELFEAHDESAHARTTSIQATFLRVTVSS